MRNNSRLKGKILIIMKLKMVSIFHSTLLATYYLVQVEI